MGDLLKAQRQVGEQRKITVMEQDAKAGTGRAGARFVILWPRAKAFSRQRTRK